MHLDKARFVTSHGQPSSHQTSFLLGYRVALRIKTNRWAPLLVQRIVKKEAIKANLVYTHAVTQCRKYILATSRKGITLLGLENSKHVQFKDGGPYC